MGRGGEEGLLREGGDGKVSVADPDHSDFDPIFHFEAAPDLY